MRRLNAKGRGIILMHDIHRATAIALPILLKELKANGYEMVHVVAAGERPESVPESIAQPTPDGKVSPTMLAGAPSDTRQKHRIRKQAASRHHPVRLYDPARLRDARMSALGG
jgi:hypothetical protein